MRAVLTRLIVASFFVSIAGTTSGCIVRTTGHGHGHARSSSHGNHRHCHYKGGKHKKQVCHNHPHNAGHH